MANTMTKMNKMINPEVMGDMISAKIEAMLKITDRKSTRLNSSHTS